MLLGLDFSIAIGFILMIGFIVLVHEFGHFITAKLLKIKVEEFSIGFGPKLLGLTRGETLYKIAPIPLGGYVKIYGMEEGEITEPERAFYNRPKWERLLVLAMGGVFNIVSAYFLLTGAYMLGVFERTYMDKVPVITWINEGSPAETAGLKINDTILAINNKKIDSWKEVQDMVLVSPNQWLSIRISRDNKELAIPLKAGKITTHEIGYIGALPIPPFKVVSVEPDSPAQKAGLKPGDIIYAVNDETMPDDNSLILAISKSPGKPIVLSLFRNNQKIQMLVTPKDIEGRGIIGARADAYLEKKSYGLGSFQRAGAELGNNIMLIFVVLKKLVTGSLSVKTLSGPIELAKVSGSAYKHGLEVFMLIMALISVNLGIINLLPVPMLDGGHIFIMFIEWAIRKEFSIKLKEQIAMVGLVLLLLLMVVVFYYDIIKLIQ